MARLELDNASGIGLAAAGRLGGSRLDPRECPLDPPQSRRKSILAHELKGYASGEGSASGKARVLTDRPTDDK